MTEYTCKICGETFKNKVQGNVSRALLRHIKEKHNISSIYEYILKVYYNNIAPTCACGCGNEVSWYYRNALYLPNHGFSKYCSCTHVVSTEEKIKKLQQTNEKKWNDENFVRQYIEQKISIDSLKSALEEFKNGKTFGKLSEKYNIDHRTLVDYWKLLKLINPEDIRKYTEYNQYIVPAKQRRKDIKEKDTVLSILYEILYNNPGYFNIRSLIRYFNKHHVDLYIHTRPETVQEMLFEKYGDEIEQYLTFGLHSREELNFTRVLIYYFGHKNVKVGKKLKYGSNNKYVYVYDICVCNKLLIEYDGRGFYHDDTETLERDKAKENFAVENGYVFMRLSDVSVRDPKTMLQIKKIIDKNNNQKQ